MNIDIRKTSAPATMPDMLAGASSRPTQDVASLFDAILRAQPQPKDHVRQAETAKPPERPGYDSQATTSSSSARRDDRRDRDEPKSEPAGQGTHAHDRTSSSSAVKDTQSRPQEPDDTATDAAASDAQPPVDGANETAEQSEDTTDEETLSEAVVEETLPGEPTEEASSVEQPTDPTAQQLASALATKPTETPLLKETSIDDSSEASAEQGQIADLSLDGENAPQKNADVPATSSDVALGTNLAGSEGVTAETEPVVAQVSTAVNAAKDMVAASSGDESENAMPTAKSQAAMRKDAAVPLHAQGTTADATAEQTPAANSEKEEQKLQPGDTSAEASQLVAEGKQASERADRDDSAKKEAKDDPKLEQAAPAEPMPAAEPVAETAPVADVLPPDDRSANGRDAQRHETHPSNQQPIVTDATARTNSSAKLTASLLAPSPREGRDSQPVEIDSARFLHRVARAFASAQQRGGEVQLRLSPPELGSLRIEVNVEDGVLTARVETESAVARTAVIENLPQLRERLAEQGVRIERFDVDLMQQGSTGTPDGSSDRQAQQPGFQRTGRNTAVAAPTTANDTTRPAGTNTGNGRLNVLV